MKIYLIKWSLSIADTLGTAGNVLISEVSSFQALLDSVLIESVLLEGVHCNTCLPVSRTYLKERCLLADV